MHSFLLFGICTLVAGQWQQLSLQHTPSARTVGAFTNTQAGPLLFGGSGKGLLADTWLFQDGDWKQEGSGPSARCLTAMAPYKSGALLFGGYSKQEHSLADTWIWDSTTGWRELQLPASPNGRSYHTLQAVPSGVILFGGTNRSSELHDTAFGDTWLFSNVDQQWHNLNLVPPYAPRARWGHGMACSPGKATNCVVFGGADLSEDDHFQDTWVLIDDRASGRSGMRWQQSQPNAVRPGPRPAGRWSFQMAACGTGALMSTGSIGYRVCTDDTWTFNATVSPNVWTTSKVNHDAIGVWKQHVVAGAEHPGTYGGAMLAPVMNVGGQAGVLLFGGVEFHNDSQKLIAHNETWFFPGASCPH